MKEESNDTKTLKVAKSNTLSKREEFAKSALTGLCTKEIISAERVAAKAVEIADAMLNALKK